MEEDLKERLAEALLRAMEYVKQRNEAWEQLAIARAELTLDEGGEIRGYATEELNEYAQKLRETARAARAKVVSEAEGARDAQWVYKLKSPQKFEYPLADHVMLQAVREFGLKCAREGMIAGWDSGEEVPRAIVDAVLRGET